MDRKEERKLAQQFGLQSTAVLGISRTLKVSRSVTRHRLSKIIDLEVVTDIVQISLRLLCKIEIKN